MSLEKNPLQKHELAAERKKNPKSDMHLSIFAVFCCVDVPSFLATTEPSFEMCFSMTVTLYPKTMSVTSADFPGWFAHL